MKAGVLLLWISCLLSIVLSLLHFIWAASARERLLILTLAVLTAGSVRWQK